jgi:hypothetical protein
MSCDDRIGDKKKRAVVSLYRVAMSRDGIADGIVLSTARPAA